MVNWASNPTMGGYDPTTRQFGPAVYQFATAGSVDVQATTRLGYVLPAPYDSRAAYINKLNIKAPLTFNAADFTANPGKKLSAAIYSALPSYFPPGHIPTPTEMLEAARTKNGGYVSRATQYVTIPQTITFDFWGPPPGGVPFNSKFWIMVVPTALADPNAPHNVTNDPPMAGITLDTFARAMSFYGQRTPAAPTIVTPASGAVVAPGASFNLLLASNDPDKVTPTDAQKANADLGGMQVQYAPLPSPSNPNPVWTDLLYQTTDPGADYTYLTPVNIVLDNLKMVDGFTLLNAIDNAGFPIICGIRNEYENTPLGSGFLPAGNWQLRARVTDVGHPYPLLPRTVAGKAPFQGGPAYWTVDSWPAVNTSPWSAAVTISIPSQVPPPIPLTPINELAVEESQPVRLGWQYRNTFVPPKAQSRRTVQVKRVIDSDWSTVLNDLNPNPYFDLPATLLQPAPHAPEYITNGNFEVSGNVGGWVIPTSATGTPTLTNVTTTPPGPHSGSRYLRGANTTNPDVNPGYAAYRLLGPQIDPGHDTFTFSGWFNARDTVRDSYVSIFFYWINANGDPLIDDAHADSFATASVPTPVGSSAYQQFTATIKRPGDGVHLAFTSYGVEPLDDDPYFRYIPVNVDDTSLIGTTQYPLADFTLQAGYEYEWRVAVTDTDGVQSSFSSPARFWVVSAAGSGDTRPIIANTVDGGTLGCGTHTVQIFRRGGKRYVGTLGKASHVDWSRVRDEISTSKIVISGWDDDCGNLLAQLQTWAYEVVIWRNNGQERERVWEGPITLLTYERDSVTIEAKDVMAYAYRKIIKQKMTDTADGDSVVNRAKRVLQNAFASDDPNILGYLQVLAKDDDAREYRSIPAYSRTAYEEVDDMAANAGLDYTAVGRAILLWGTKHRIGTLPEFTDNDLGAVPIVSEYGMSFANRYVVSDGNGVWGEATRLDVSGNDDTYGVVEMLSSSWASDSDEDTGTYTQAGLQKVIQSFSGYAERSIADRYPPPVVVRIPDNTTLNPGAVISIQQLVPGVVIPLRSTGTLRDVIASQKLDSVTVTEENGSETITVVMSPFSRDDVVTEES